MSEIVTDSESTPETAVRNWHPWKRVLFPLLLLAVVAIPAMQLRDPLPATSTLPPAAAPSRADSVPAPAPAKTSAGVADAPVFPVADHELNSVVSRFGDARDGGSRSHLGIDIAAPRGTPVLAVNDGRIDRVEFTRAGGRVVWLSEKNSARRHYFAHLDSIKVVRGQAVRAGDVIGTVGNTGNAIHTSPHLHYAVRDGRDILDPISLFNETGTPTDARVMRTRLAGAALKAAPGGATIAVLSANQPVTIQSESGRFYRVRYRGKTGYIARWLLKA